MHYLTQIFKVNCHTRGHRHTLPKATGSSYNMSFSGGNLHAEKWQRACCPLNFYYYTA